MAVDVVELRGGGLGEEREALEVVGMRSGIGPRLDIGERIRLVAQPPVDPDAFGAHGHHREPPVGELAVIDDARRHADVGSDIAAADLAPPLDEHDAELGVGVDAVSYEVAVALLEDVQGQGEPGEQHRAEREHRPGGHVTRLRAWGSARRGRDRRSARPG